MKTLTHCLLLTTSALLIASCASSKKNTASGQPVGSTDTRDDYAAVEVSDPIEPVNRGIFAFNDAVYNFIFRPISKGYETVAPKPVRKGIDNVFENAKYPVRFVNSGLQGKFKRAGQETQKFAVNTVAGFGGLIKQSDRIPSLSDVPEEDTGQTLATWGIGHGPYIVLPLLGPSSVREVFGQAGDYALNPINWGFALNGDAQDWAWIPPTANTVRLLPSQLKKYDESRNNAVDPYLAVRSTYIQNRQAAAEK